MGLLQDREREAYAHILGERGRSRAHVELDGS